MAIARAGRCVHRHSVHHVLAPRWVMMMMNADARAVDDGAFRSSPSHSSLKCDAASCLNLPEALFTRPFRPLHTSEDMARQMQGLRPISCGRH
eukprot:8628100-Alexandrium_andersonii.AAC.1